MRLKFDLKGSKHHRYTMKKKKLIRRDDLQKITTSITLKDIELIKILRTYPDILNLTLDDRMKLIKQLEKDSMFLRSQNIMDYSLLLAIEESGLNE